MKPQFEDIVKDYLNLVYFFALRWVRKEDVDDMVQNTFLKALESYDNFHFHSSGQLKSWLLTICKNIIIDRGRTKTSIKIDQEEFENIATSENIEEILDETIKKDEFQQIVTRLDSMEPAEQELVRLRIFEAMEFEEIGHVFDISEAAAKMRFYRTVEKLKKAL